MFSAVVEETWKLQESKAKGERLKQLTALCRPVLFMVFHSAVIPPSPYTIPAYTLLEGRDFIFYHCL
jgi:hypothetical protein